LSILRKPASHRAKIINPRVLRLIGETSSRKWVLSGSKSGRIFPAGKKKNFEVMKNLERGDLEGLR
jgi:hypothetical protein